MRYPVALLALATIYSFLVPEVSGYPLSIEQRNRLHQFIPRSFPKLEARDPVHVVLLGDSVASGYTPLATAGEQNNPLFSFPGIFLSRVAREFFYPGGVRLLNPPEGGINKRSEYLGRDLTFENLSEANGTMSSGLRRATTDAFLHHPDLLLIHYGLNDALANVPVDTYRRALHETLVLAKSRQTDVIVFSPSLANLGSGAMEWGMTRPYAIAAEEVCSANGVLFIDLGKHLMVLGGGVDAATQAEAAMQVVGDKLKKMFHHESRLDQVERIHPDQRTHELLGQAAFEDLKNGEREAPFTFAGGAAFENAGVVNVSLSIRNQTKEDKEGTVGALSVGGGYIPVTVAQRFSVKAGATTQVMFKYQRPVVGKSRDGSDHLYPFEAADTVGRFSFVVEDLYSSYLVNMPLRIGPVTAIWTSRQYVNVSDDLRIEWDLLNGTDKNVSGNFQVGMAEIIGEPTAFSVNPLGDKKVFSVFPFQPEEGKFQFQRDVWIQLDVDHKVVRFTRELEATRDIVLGEEMPLLPWSSYVNATPAGGEPSEEKKEGGVSIRFDADDQALYLVANVSGMPIPNLGDRAALKARLFLDARPSGEVRTFSVVEPVEIHTRGSDGPGQTSALPLGSFGTGYDLLLSPAGITSVLETTAGGGRNLTIRVPRSYLHRHEWNLNSPDSLLGFRVEITAADQDPGAADPFPLINSYVSNSATFAWDGKMIHSVYEKDARSLSTLRLSRQPVRSWSVRLY